MNAITASSAIATVQPITAFTCGFTCVAILSEKQAFSTRHSTLSLSLTKAKDVKAAKASSKRHLMAEALATGQKHSVGDFGLGQHGCDPRDVSLDFIRGQALIVIIKVEDHETGVVELT